MIAFAGSAESLYILNEVASAAYDDYSNCDSLDEVVQSFLGKQYDTLIIDLEYFSVNSDTAYQVFSKLSEVSTAHIIFFAIGYTPESKLIQVLHTVGFRSFVTAKTIGDRKEQLKICLAGGTTLDQMDKWKAIQAKPDIVVDTNKPTFKTVGFIGSQSRVGTTTQAIQFCKYLQFTGATAAYIEANEHAHIKTLTDLYEDAVEHPDLCMTRLSKLDMYYNRYEISEIYKQPYDYFVFDFGVVDNNSLFSFLEKDIKIVVAGTKPWEIDNTLSVLKIFENKDVQFIFSFTEDSLREQYRQNMFSKDNTFFCDYSPNMFSLNSNDQQMHKSILGKLNLDKTQKQKRKFKLFGGGKKK